MPLSKSDSVWQQALLNRYNHQRQALRQRASRHHWPLTLQYRNGRRLYLQDWDATGEPVYYQLHWNTTAAAATRTQPLYNGTLGVSLNGGSTRLNGKLGLWDGGKVLTTHRELTGRVNQRETLAELSDHATHLAGTLIAKGINAPARGMANGARLAVWDLTNDIAEMTTAAPSLLISNHAYGPVSGWVLNLDRPGANADQKWEWWGNAAISPQEDYQFGFYTTRAQDLDRIAANAPNYLIVKSADNKHGETGPPTGTPYYLRNSDQQSTLPRSRNDAYDVIPAEATAKNILTVGAADVTFTAGVPQSFSVASYSGWGPTDDGRIKPDLLGYGTAVTSTIAQSTTAYGTFTGTSMATANVSGTLLLLQELYANRNGGQFMRSATLKGLAIHTASRTTLHAGPDYRQGWGLLNAEQAARVILNEQAQHLILEKSLLPGTPLIYRVVASGTEPLVVTLCWTDPEGQATAVEPVSLNNRTPKLINDLDVRVSDGSVASLPWVLNPAQPNQPATAGDNIRDNVEQVWIANPVAGRTYTITVSHKGTLRNRVQPYALLASGIGGQSACAGVGVSLQPNRDTTVCRGTSLLLQATSTPSVRFEWLYNGKVLSGNTGNTLLASQEGSYAVRVVKGGCTVTAPAIQVAVATVSASVVPAGVQSLCEGKTVTLASSTGSRYAYQWFRNDQPIARATQPVYAAKEGGRYRVRVGVGGCQMLSEVTTVQPVVCSASASRVGVPAVEESATAEEDTFFQIYPVPASEVIIVNYRTNNASFMTAELVDSMGKRLAIHPLQGDGTTNYRTRFILSGLPGGKYGIRLLNGRSLFWRSFVKQ